MLESIVIDSGPSHIKQKKNNSGPSSRPSSYRVSF